MSRRSPTGIVVAFRRRWLLTIWAVSASICVFPALAHASGPVTQTFTTVGESTFVVPSGVSHINVTVNGAQGGGGQGNGCEGGPGAVVTATLPVTAGETLYIEVGGDGGDVETVAGAGVAGSGGGGVGGLVGSGFGGGGGGGASDIRALPAADALSPSDTRLVVAGGGGGGGDGYLGCSGGSAGATPGAAQTAVRWRAAVAPEARAAVVPRAPPPQRARESAPARSAQVAQEPEAPVATTPAGVVAVATSAEAVAGAASGRWRWRRLQLHRAIREHTLYRHVAPPDRRSHHHVRRRSHDDGHVHDGRPVDLRRSGWHHKYRCYSYRRAGRWRILCRV